MRAVVLEEFGSPLTLSEIETPVAGPGQVLVRIAASGVNPLDLKLKAGSASRAAPSAPARAGCPPYSAWTWPEWSNGSAPA